LPPGTEIKYKHVPVQLFPPIKTNLQITQQFIKIISVHCCSININPLNSLIYEACVYLKKTPKKEEFCVKAKLRKTNKNGFTDAYSAYFDIPFHQLKCDDFYVVYFKRVIYNFRLSTKQKILTRTPFLL